MNSGMVISQMTWEQDEDYSYDHDNPDWRKYQVPEVFITHPVPVSRVYVHEFVADNATDRHEFMNFTSDPLAKDGFDWWNLSYDKDWDLYEEVDRFMGWCVKHHTDKLFIPNLKDKLFMGIRDYGRWYQAPTMSDFYLPNNGRHWADHVVNFGFERSVSEAVKAMGNVLISRDIKKSTLTFWGFQTTNWPEESVAWTPPQVMAVCEKIKDMTDNVLSCDGEKIVLSLPLVPKK
jgi:hypothetical protein